MNTLSPRRAVWLVMRRELNTRLRTKAFLIGTAVMLLLLLGYVGFQASLASSSSLGKVGLTGQSIGLAQQLTAAAEADGQRIQTVAVTDNSGLSKVESGDLDALVSGPSGQLHVDYKSDLDSGLRRVLDHVAQQEVLDGELAKGGAIPSEVMARVANTHVDTKAMTPEPAGHTQRLVIGLLQHPDLRDDGRAGRGRGEIQPRGGDPALQRPAVAAAVRQGARHRAGRAGPARHHRVGRRGRGLDHRSVHVVRLRDRRAAVGAGLVPARIPLVRHGLRRTRFPGVAPG